MKVVYFSQDYTAHDYRFLEKLAQTPHEVWYLRFEANPLPYVKYPVPPGIQVIDWRGGHTYNLGWWGRLRLFLDFRRLMRRLQPDLVHAGPVQTCGFFAALAGIRPLLLMSWGSDILAQANSNPVQRWITRFTIKRADMIACDCAAVRDMIVKLTGYPADRISVFPWGVDLDRFRPAPSGLNLREGPGWKDSKIVITTRSLEPVYGVNVFLEAAAKVVEEEPDARFLLLGDGSLRPNVESFISEHHLEQMIRLVGRVSRDMLPDYFNEADLYVSSSYSDGTSVSLLEAMASRLPVVVSDIAANREWVTPGVNGWLSPPGDARALSSAILEALEQSDKAETMAENNLSVARQKADWNRNFAVLLEVYERLGSEEG